MGRTAAPKLLMNNCGGPNDGHYAGAAVGRWVNASIRQFSITAAARGQGLGVLISSRGKAILQT